MDFKEHIKVIYSLLLLVLLLATVAISASVYLVIDPQLKAFQVEKETVLDTLIISGDEVVDGLHVRTGLLEGTGMQEVINNCTSCHSSRLIIQNRMSRDRWLATIRWMQETQNLWSLGENEDIILDYLAEKYAPSEVGRRKNLTNIEWYELKEN